MEQPAAHIAPESPFEPALPGFEHIHRYWDSQREAVAAKLKPGEYYVTQQDECVVTVLGSCVSACLRDPVAGIGGMNHFMLPVHKEHYRGASDTGAAARYGNVAMEHLINEILKRGGLRNRIEVKLFGGGRILPNMSDVGAQNIRFVREYLRLEGLPVLSEDLGDVYPRKVVYLPRSGRVFIKRLRSLHNNTLARRELRYLRDLQADRVSGDVELF